MLGKIRDINKISGVKVEEKGTKKPARMLAYKL